MSKPINVSDSEFESVVLQADKPVMVDFWAEWCGPCRQVAPSIEQLAQDYADQVVFAKVNVDHNPEMPTKYGVRSIPTLLMFKDGKPVGQLIGGVAKPVIEKLVVEALPVS